MVNIIKVADAADKMVMHLQYKKENVQWYLQLVIQNDIVLDTTEINGFFQMYALEQICRPDCACQKPQKPRK